LVKSGYKPEIKYKSLNILLYFWFHNENQVYESGNFYSFLATENLQKHFFSKTLVSNFSFWWNFASKKEKG
jgi:hypothetical protein